MTSYPGFGQDFADAVSDFALREYTQTLGNAVTFVRAEAKTGSTYQVCVARIEGTSLGQNTAVVSVLQPWQSVWTCCGGMLTADYVLEHWGAHRRKTMHGGDLAALTMAINLALGFGISEVNDWMQMHVSRLEMSAR